MVGSEKLKPLLIGKSAKPRCFKNIKTFPMTYRANKKAYMTAEWVISVNLDFQRKNRKIFLFLDNCTAHNNISPLSNVKEVVMQLLDSLEEGVEYKLTLFSALNIADKAWKNIRNPTIKNCFRTCGFIKEEEQSIMEPEAPFGWDLVTQNEENPVTFKDIVHFDDDIAVTGMLTEEEILAPTEETEEEDNVL
ncbi:tigger transposable element-derived protein 6-like [Diorhabda sublineata]|uniref:tigger transposable element-derived protein 6-like n=1 Tax=Diorhabda sublineata TaxID=1163346 RepID=UPI0024E0869C|nr:tigger transposable element-derived protein 6-like [Diorhabda sublineata]